MHHFDTAFENRIFWEGLSRCWEPVSVQVWEALSRKSKVILDIGSNTGVYSLIAVAAQPGADVHAFEPLPKMHKKLEINNKLNGSKIKTHTTALSDKSGEAILYDLPNDYMRQASLNATYIEGEAVEIRVTLARLDHFIEENSLQRIDLMKVDVETHEPEVLKGMGKYLTDFRPTVLVEVLNDQIAKELLTLFTDAGYQYFYHVDEHKGLSETDIWVGKKSRNYIAAAYDLSGDQELSRFFIHCQPASQQA